MTHFGLQTCEFWLGRSTRHHACYAAIARPEDERISAAPSVSTGRLDGSHVEAMWRLFWVKHDGWSEDEKWLNAKRSNVLRVGKTLAEASYLAGAKIIARRWVGLRPHRHPWGCTPVAIARPEPIFRLLLAAFGVRREPALAMFRMVRDAL
jgi:hypothetical protein